jgi:hypothetical protein
MGLEVRSVRGDWKYYVVPKSHVAHCLPPRLKDVTSWRFCATVISHLRKVLLVSYSSRETRQTFKKVGIDIY